MIVSKINFSSNMRGRFFSSAIACAAILGITGCVAIPSDHDVLPQRDLAQAQLAADIRLAHDGWPEAQWWTQYGDSQLDGLIHQALADSPSLTAAAARMGSAQAALTISKASEGIGIDFGTAVNRQRYSANGLFPPPIGGSTYTDEMLQVQAHYDFDWWGKHRAQIAAALGEGNARRADYAQAEQILAAAVAETYFNLQSAWARLDNLQKMAALRQALVEDKTKRIAHGLASIDEQSRAETQLSDLNKRIAQLEAQAVRE